MTNLISEYLQVCQSRLEYNFTVLSIVEQSAIVSQRSVPFSVCEDFPAKPQRFVVTLSEGVYLAAQKKFVDVYCLGPKNL
jgi:hypothetical protein